MSASRSPSPGSLTRWLALAAAAAGLLSAHVAASAPPVHTPAEVRATPAQFIVLAVANPMVSRPGAVGGTAHGYGGDSGYRVGASAAAVIRDIARQYSLTRVSEWPIESLGMHCVLFRIPPGTTREAVIEKLRGDARVTIVQPLNEFESATDDPAAFDDPYARLQVNVRTLHVAEAHAISRGAGVRVAVIDTGVDTRHPDLVGRTQLTRNYVDDDESRFRADRHGTQVAGLIAAAANNGIGIVGVAPDVKLQVFKACWQPAAAHPGRCNSFTLAQALADAIAARSQVINLSLVGPSDPLLEALVGKAIASGIVVVGAASSDPRLAFPARLPGVLPVTEAEVLGDDRHLRAPARDLVTLVPDGHYDFASGSSLATAQVTGVVALLLARNQRLGIPRLRELLAQSSRQHDDVRGGFVSVDACAALASIVKNARCRI